MKTTRILRGAGAAGLALALTACLKMDMDLEINTEDTIDGSIVMAFSQEFMDMAGSMGDDAETEDMFDEFLNMDVAGEDVPDYATVEPYDDGEFVGQQVTFDGAPLEDFGTDEMSGLSITRDGEEFVVDGDMDMADSGAGEMGDIPPGMLEGMDFDIRLSITFPGEVLEHNGSLDGTTVTWEPQIGESNEMFARSQDSGAGGDGFPAWLWIVIGVVVVAGLVALLFVWSRGKGGAQPEADSGGVPSPAEPAAAATPSDAPAGSPGTMPPPPPQPEPEAASTDSDDQPEASASDDELVDPDDPDAPGQSR